MTAPRILLLLALSSGCASAGHEARSAGDAGRGQQSASFVASGALTASEASGTSTTRATQANVSAGQPIQPHAAPLRHFYLLSPGPNATLVITRSDVTTR